MAEHWISTRKAIEIIKSEDALVERLRTGAIRARAERLATENRVAERVMVDRDFWRHDVYYDPTFDWQTGDCRSTIDGIETSISGVSIDVAGVLEIVPFEQRGLVARGLSVAGSPDWVSAQEAKRLVYSASRANVNIAGQLITEQAKLGFVVARAVLAQCQRHNDPIEWTWEEREWNVPTEFWAEFLYGSASEQDWSVGRFSGSGIWRGSICSITLSGVHFHRPSLEAFLGIPEEVASPEKDTSNRGRKSLYKWPETISAIWGQIYRGELQPKVQAEIEQAMLKFLASPDGGPGESTVRPYAKAIFDEFLKE